MQAETRTFTITTSSRVMRRFERFLALLHFNSSFGHSALFGMALDGDGSEKVEVAEVDRTLCHEVDAIGGVGYGVEIACEDRYSGRFIEKSDTRSKYYTGSAANLYKDGEIIKTIPTKDWNAPSKYGS